jgi:hypothetical protein
MGLQFCLNLLGFYLGMVPRISPLNQYLVVVMPLADGILETELPRILTVSSQGGLDGLLITGADVAMVKVCTEAGRGTPDPQAGVVDLIYSIGMSSLGLRFCRRLSVMVVAIIVLLKRLWLET